MKITKPYQDETFAKLLEDHPLDEFNQKIHFPDAKEDVVKELNTALKIRLKIIESKREEEKDELGL